MSDYIGPADVPHEPTTCPHCGSTDIDRGATGRLVGIFGESGTAIQVRADGTKVFRGFVTLTATSVLGPGLAGQLDPGEVRKLALQLLSVAEAAEQDAMIFRVMTGKVGAPADAVAQLVRDLREERGHG